MKESKVIFKYTDVNYGNKQADKYGLLTNIDLDNLKKHGNLLISLEKYDKALINVSRMKFNEDLTGFREHRQSNKKILLIGKTSKELKKEILRLTGFENIKIRRIDPDAKEEPVYLIIERDKIESMNIKK